MQRSLNPGNIHVRIGMVLARREDAILRRDLEGVSDCQDEIADYLSPHLTAKQWQAYEAMPGLTYGDGRQHHEVMADLRARLRYLFKMAKAHNVFTKAEVEVTDADDAEDEEAEVLA